MSDFIEVPSEFYKNWRARFIKVAGEKSQTRTNGSSRHLAKRAFPSDRLTTSAFRTSRYSLVNWKFRIMQ